MPNFILKRRTNTMSAIHFKRQKIGSVWVAPESTEWSATLTIEGRKLSAKAGSKQEAFAEIVAQANRVTLGCEPEDQAGARAKLAALNAAVQDRADRINAEAGARVVKVTNSRVDV